MNLAEKIWNPQTGKNLRRRVNENVHKNGIEGSNSLVVTSCF